MQRRNNAPPRIRLAVVGGLLLLTFAGNAFAAIAARQHVFHQRLGPASVTMPSFTFS